MAHPKNRLQVFTAILRFGAMLSCLQMAEAVTKEQTGN